ncbi:MCE family protein [Paraconexibacter antarcticus]|uniref:MCE family protein n=1 Tax=Paraconexibacter antarcticus TaxID=2949664 RepID=A0ABY5DXA6_9ACTN|nr:MCE family protein [Paraconexibacter antarcticus]UTI66184.1 MCE family protein [Paraconexibacter antarcticus]
MAPHTRSPAAACAAAALACAAVAAVALLGGSNAQHFDLRVANAGQLVKGNLVKVGGFKAGLVESIDLASDNQAIIRIKVDDTDVLPLHEGTRAEIRLSSLSSVAGRYVSLLPGPNNKPKLDDGATLAATDVSAPVELDQLFSVLNAETRRAFRSALSGSATIYRGRAADANRALRALNPALTELATTAHEVGRDDANLERFLVQSASVMTVVAQHNPEVDSALRDASTTATTLAAKRRDLQTALRRAPGAFGQTTATLERLDATGRELQPTLRLARPVAPRLATLIRNLHTLLPPARTALASAERLVPLTMTTLRTLPRLSRTGAPALREAARALTDVAPIVAGTRPYVPDLINAFTGTFGGRSFGYYDANGHYGRVRPMIYAGSTQTPGILSSLLGVSVAGKSERRNQLARCPGAATGPAADGSNASFASPGVPCDAGLFP